MFDDVREALLKITQSFDSLVDAMSKLFEDVENLSVKGTSPREYGRKKHRHIEPVRVYQCNIKPQRNLPYQRRSY
jgi:hypothetical protein